MLGLAVTRFHLCMEKGKVSLHNTRQKRSGNKYLMHSAVRQSNQTEVGNASIKAFVLLYGGKEGDYNLLLHYYMLLIMRESRD